MASDPPTTQPFGNIHEFDCIDCGTHVVRVVQTHANDDDVCGECRFLREVEDDSDRAHLRAFLNKTKLFSGGPE